MGSQAQQRAPGGRAASASERGLDFQGWFPLVSVCQVPNLSSIHWSLDQFGMLGSGGSGTCCLFCNAARKRTRVPTHNPELGTAGPFQRSTFGKEHWVLTRKAGNNKAPRFQSRPTKPSNRNLPTNYGTSHLSAGPLQPSQLFHTCTTTVSLFVVFSERSSSWQARRMRREDYLARLKAAGVDSLPGTSAEILDDKLRAQAGERFGKTVCYLGLELM